MNSFVFGFEEEEEERMSEVMLEISVYVFYKQTFFKLEKRFRSWSWIQSKSKRTLAKTNLKSVKEFELTIWFLCYWLQKFCRTDNLVLRTLA